MGFHNLELLNEKKKKILYIPKILMCVYVAVVYKLLCIKDEKHTSWKK